MDGGGRLIRRLYKRSIACLSQPRRRVAYVPHRTLSTQILDQGRIVECHIPPPHHGRRVQGTV